MAKLLGCTLQTVERSEMQDLCLRELVSWLANVWTWKSALKAERQIGDVGHRGVLMYSTQAYSASSYHARLWGYGDG